MTILLTLLSALTLAAVVLCVWRMGSLEQAVREFVDFSKQQPPPATLATGFRRRPPGATYESERDAERRRRQQ